MQGSRDNFIKHLKKYGHAVASADKFRDWFDMKRITDAALKRALNTISAEYEIQVVGRDLECIHFGRTRFGRTKIPYTLVPETVLVFDRALGVHHAIRPTNT